MSANDVARPQSSRRTILSAGLAALVGSSVAGGAAKALAVGPADVANPDAQLIGWGDRLQVCHDRLHDLEPSKEAAWERTAAALQAWRADAKGKPGYDEEAITAKYGEFGRENGWVDHAIDEVWDEIEVLTQKIMKAEAATVAGAAVKARLVLDEVFRGDDWEIEPDDLDWPKQVVLAAVASICALAGIDIYGQPLTGGEA